MPDVSDTPDTSHAPAAWSFPAPPVHPLAAFVTVALDGLWFSVEVPVTATGAGVVAVLPLGAGCLTLCWVAVTLVQRHVQGDPWGAAISKGLVMGVAAGVPYPVIGTALGVPLLAWAGVRSVHSWLSGVGPRQVIDQEPRAEDGQHAGAVRESVIPD